METLLEFIIRAFFWCELFLPFFAGLYFFYWLGAWVLEVRRTTKVESAPRVCKNSTKKSTKKSAKKSSAAVVDTFSDSFKLSLPQFDD